MRFPDPGQRMFLCCRAILWLASRLAPARQRAGWLRSWSSQVWHWCRFLEESGQLTRDKKLELARFCWSAFPDAFWRRYDRETFLERTARLRRSPSFCFGAIALALVVVTLAGGVIPAAR